MLNEAAVRMTTDGTNLFLPPDTMVVTQLLQPEGLAYDARKFHYVGTVDQQNTFWVLRRGPKATLEGMRANEVFMGSSGKGSTGYMIPALAGPLLGLKIKQVDGYDSSREMILAMDGRDRRNAASVVRVGAVAAAMVQARWNCDTSDTSWSQR